MDSAEIKHSLLSFFQQDDPTLSAIKTKLEESDLNNMNPLQAFDLLRSLKIQTGLITRRAIEASGFPKTCFY